MLWPGNNSYLVELIRERVAWVESWTTPDQTAVFVSLSARGEPVAGTDNTRSGLAFRNIARRIRGEDVALMDLDALNGTWMTRLVKFFNPSVRV